MFKFIHSADIHLDSPLRGLELPEDAPHDQIHAATRLALNNMVDLAIREKVSFVLVGGDVYDGDWRDFNTGLFFTQRMAHLRDANIRFLSFQAITMLPVRYPKPYGCLIMFTCSQPESLTVL